jgi:hypothetical protein
MCANCAIMTSNGAPASAPCVLNVWRRSWKRKPGILHAVTSFRQDFTHVTIGMVTSHFCFVFFDQCRDFRGFIGKR